MLGSLLGFLCKFRQRSSIVFIILACITNAQMFWLVFSPITLPLNAPEDNG